MTRFNLIITSTFCAVTFMCTVAQAVVLTGSGSHLPVPANMMPNAQVRTVTGNTVSGPWQGSWSSPAFPDWVGSFDVTGPLPAGTANPIGISQYDFTSMPTGALPVGTYFRLGDVDQGSVTTEIITLTATNSSGTITTPWLDEAIGAGGSGSGFAGSITLNDMPGWSYAGGVYEFDGSTVPGNPNISLAMTNNMEITHLSVTRSSEFANFSLMAPIPEPSTLVMGCLGFGMIAKRRKPRQTCSNQA